MDADIIGTFDELGRIFIPSGMREIVFGTDDTKGMSVAISIHGDIIILKPNDGIEVKGEHYGIY